MSAAPAIVLAGLRRRIGGRAVLDGVDLDVAAGELVALLGPSGAGKTMLLRAIAGLEPADEGLLRLDGRDMAGVAPGARGIGFVFQHAALFPHMTVAQNIGFGPSVRGDPAADVAGLLALVRLEGAADWYPERLSGGERQRVAIARALATGPRVLLLDEPFGALDPPVRRDLRVRLRALHDRLGLTTVLVTHDPREAFALADRIVMMREGRIVQAGPPAEIRGAPASAFVRDFLHGE